MSRRRDVHAGAQAAALASASPPRVPAVTAVLAGCAIALALFRLFVLLPHHRFDRDELEHMQSAWLQGQGLMIYRDFFEHHPPLFYLLLRPLSAMRDGAEKLIAARMLVAPFAVASVALTAYIASKRRGLLAAFGAAALLSTLLVFEQKSIELRPDVPALCFLLIAMAVAVSDVLTPKRRAFAAAAFTVALLFTSKLIFAAPALMTLFLADMDAGQSRWQRLRPAAIGVAVPAIATGVWLAANGALRQAWYFNTTFNLRVPFTFRGETLAHTLMESLSANWAFWPLAIVSAAVLLGRLARNDASGHERRWQLVVGGAAAGLTLGLTMIPVPLPQYLMLMSAPFCIIAADGLTALSNDSGSRARARRVMGATLGIVALAQPVQGLIHERTVLADRQVADLERLWRTVPTDARVFDCWTGYGLFRKPAYFYQFLGPDVVGALENSDMAEFQSSLLGSLHGLQPYVVNGSMLTALPDDVIAFLKDHYVDSGDGTLLAYRNRP